MNLYAGQFGGPNGIYGRDYVYPGNSTIDYYAGKGMDVIRIPFDWERVQRTENGPLNATELGRIDAIVDHARSLGVKVVLDPHNYGYAYGGLIGTTVSNASFADFWSKLAGHYKDASNVVFGLMNEPHDQSAAQWVVSANAAVAAIRDTGATQMILVPGSYWSGAYSWVSGVPDRPNSDDNDTVVGQGVVDPLNNYAFDVHTYFDGNNAGLGNTVSATIGVDKLKEITAWAEATGHKLFAGEFGTDTSELSQKALDNMLAYMDEHPVWIGGTYWAGGPWIGSYKFSVE
ncbi:MAG: glycoside hydrolase family 5 protein, partial [Microvirga sp.]